MTSRWSSPGQLRDSATGAARLARGLVPWRRATPRRLVRMAQGISTHGLSLAGLTRVAAIRDGRDVVLVDGQGPVTAEQLDRWAATVAGELSRREILNPGHRAGVLCRRGRGLLIATIAATELGADVVLLDPELSAPALGDALRQAELHVVVHDDELTDLLGAAGFRGTVILADASAPGLLSLPAMAALPRVDVPRPPRPGRIVAVPSTRTGQLRRPHPTPTAATGSLPVATIVQRLTIRRGSALLIVPPLYHPLGLGFMGVALGLECPAVLPGPFDAPLVLQLVDAHAVETLVTVPGMLLRLTAALGDRPAPPSLRTIVSGGGPLLPNAWRRAAAAFGPIVHNVYGTPETGWCSLASPADLLAAPGTIGPPVAGVELAILDDAGQPVDAGVTGHVMVASPVVLDGDRVRARRGQMTDTGDLGHHDENGRLFLDGRADERVVVAGRPVFTTAVEDVLLGHPGVEDVAVTAISGSSDGSFSARVVLRAGASLTADNLRTHVAARLGPAAVPGDLTLVSAIPRFSAGRPRPPVG